MTQELTQKVLNYLVARPYQEVFQLINEIVADANKPVPAAEEKPVEPEKKK
jgi:hypothetical protein